MENYSDIEYILNGFMLIIMACFVMWMAAGFAMLEAGLTRSKNNVSILTKNIVLYSISCVVYFFIGYNLMYGEGNFLFGSGFMLDGITKDTHPVMADFFFQVVFVATAASIISGAVAERIKLIPFFIFVVVLAALIYPVQGHWTWGGSLTGTGGILEGFTDFAGSTIVHSVGGWAALAGVIVLGARTGKYTKSGKIKAIQGSSLPLATLGTFILWLGWFGFNGGSQLSMSSTNDIDAIALIIASTNMAAATGAITVMILTKLIYKKIDLTMVLNGALGGLVAVTAGPDNGMIAAFVVAIVAGFLLMVFVPLFDKLKLDDPVGALSVHLVNGIWGTIAVAIFNSEVTLFTQLKGIVLIGVFTFTASFIVWYILKKIMGIRSSINEEIEGEDIYECGLEAYPEFKITTHD